MIFLDTENLQLTFLRKITGTYRKYIQETFSKRFVFPWILIGCSFIVYCWCKMKITIFSSSTLWIEFKSIMTVKLWNNTPIKLINYFSYYSIFFNSCNVLWQKTTPERPCAANSSETNKICLKHLLRTTFCEVITY